MVYNYGCIEIIVVTIWYITIVDMVGDLEHNYGKIHH